MDAWRCGSICVPLHIHEEIQCLGGQQLTHNVRRVDGACGEACVQHRVVGQIRLASAWTTKQQRERRERVSVCVCVCVCLCLCVSVCLCVRGQGRHQHTHRHAKKHTCAHCTSNARSSPSAAGAMEWRYSKILLTGRYAPCSGKFQNPMASSLSSTTSVTGTTMSNVHVRVFPASSEACALTLCGEPAHTHTRTHTRTYTRT